MKSKTLDFSEVHFICMICNTEQWDDFFYPDGLSMCEPCRERNGVFGKEYYTNLQKDRGELKK